MTVRKPLPFALALALLFLFADAAFAQAPAPSSSTFNISWSALDPGDDWTWQMLQSVFPVSGAPPTATGTAATVIGTLLGQITGLVMAIAMFFLCYLTIINIHRVAESAQIMTSAMTSFAAVRIGFAAIMMFPLSSGFSVGQAGVMQVAGWGIGMARSLYANAVKAIGPDAMVIADPVIPGTRTIVLGLLEDELCRSLVNQASGSDPRSRPDPHDRQRRQGRRRHLPLFPCGRERHRFGDLRLGFRRQFLRRRGDARRRHHRHGRPAALDPQRHSRHAAPADRFNRPVVLAEQDAVVFAAAARPLPERHPDPIRSS